MWSRPAAVLTTVAMLACGDRQGTVPSAITIETPARATPSDAAVTSLYDGYVAHARALNATLPVGPFPIPSASEIRINQVGTLDDLPLYFADGGMFDDTPRPVYLSLLLSRIDGRVVEVRPAISWRATSAIRIVGCSDQFVPRYSDLMRHAMTEDQLAVLERTECVDLTPRVAALFPPELDPRTLDARIATLFMLRDGRPGIDVVRDAHALAGRPLAWTKQPHPTISPPSLTRTADGVEVRAIVMTEGGVLAVILHIAHGHIELSSEAIAIISRRIPG